MRLLSMASPQMYQGQILLKYNLTAIECKRVDLQLAQERTK